MIQPPRVVVPSNAPPLPDATEGGHPSTVLQEHSGNRQLPDYAYSQSSEQKYPVALLAENAPLKLCQPAQHVYRQHPLQRHHYHRYGRGYIHDHPEEQARREKQARFLYGRFRSSDHYMKYRNRQHTSKEEKAGQANVWPDRLELAFFRALVQWPPMGRRKLPHKEKQRGRNELIADYIEELTGEKRSRKQVSSHIQVLKPFVQHDPHIMRWLSKDDMGAHASRHYSGRAMSTHDTRRSSHYAAVAAPVEHAQPPVPAMSKAEWFHLSQHRYSLELFEPHDFQMFVQRKFGNDQAERLHTYTSSIQKPRLPDMQLHDCQSSEERHEHNCRSLDVDFPLLAAMHKRRPLDCSVLVAEASLAFPVDSFKDPQGNGLPGVELGISFLCKSRHLPVNAVVQCQNTFYKDGTPLRDQLSANPVTFTQLEDGKGVETQVKFGSIFWAKTLAALATKLKASTDPNKDPREEVANIIHGITACQEIGVLTETGFERLLVIYWNFRLSTGHQGRAYWMRIVPSPTTPTTNAEQAKCGRVDSVYDHGLSYAEPSLQSPFEYDSGVVPAASWPSSLDDGTNTAPQSAVDFNGDNAFDFSGGNINISYDPALDFSNFDSSAFNFDAGADFAQDPALQDYSQQSTQDFSQADEYSQSTQAYSQQSQGYSQPTYSQDADYSTQWVDYYSVDNQQSVTGASSFTVLTTDSQPQEVFDAYVGHYDQTFSVGPEGQAYGGAGRDLVKDEDPLAALTDASYSARVLPGQEQHQQ